jgi:hypothetical protein
MRIGEALTVFGLASGQGVTDAQARSIYKTLAKENHPDLGGSVEMMALINDAWETIARAIREGYISETEACHYDLPGQLREILAQLQELDGLTLELCGSWLWVSGETRQHKEALKAMGCRYAPKKKRWYWRSPDQAQKRKRRKPVPMEKIRSKYGSQDVTEHEAKPPKQAQSQLIP